MMNDSIVGRLRAENLSEGLQCKPKTFGTKWTISDKNRRQTVDEGPNGCCTNRCGI